MKNSYVRDWLFSYSSASFLHNCKELVLEDVRSLGEMIYVCIFNKKLY